MRSPTGKGNVNRKGGHTPVVSTTKISVANGVNAAIGDEKDAFSKLGVMISNLMEFVSPPHNVHGEIKSQVGAIRSICFEVQNKLYCSKKTNAAVEVATQTPSKSNPD